jgi:sporulation protein YlmC with PRC-barrel domain
MDLQKDAMIVTHDGQEVGHLDRVAINPRSKEVTHLVVRKGRLFPVDKVIEMSYVDSVTPERIILRPELGDPEYLPPFQVKYYVGTNAPMAPDAGFGGLGGVPVRGIPDSALPLPKLPPAGKELEVEQNVPDTTVALKEGAKVVAEDGKAVGQVVRITADETTGTATHFVVTMGTVGKTHKAVPTDWIGDVQEKEVKLLVEADAVEQLSDYEEPSHAPSEPMR